MTSSRSSKLSLLALGALMASSFLFGDNDQAIVDETIALARSYLGPQAKLDAVSTLVFTGVVVAGSGESGTTEVIYKKPFRSKIRSVINGYEETSTLSRTEAWRQVRRVDQPGAWSMEFYEIRDIDRMRALAGATLSFLKKPTERGGSVTYHGTETVDDREARVLVYDHGNGIWFKRFIDAQTGKVLRMENDIGMIFKESGEIMADGIRFPAKLVTETPTPQGSFKMEVSYSAIRVNQEISDEIFEVPLLTGKQR